MSLSNACGLELDDVLNSEFILDSEEQQHHMYNVEQNYRMSRGLQLHCVSGLEAELYGGELKRHGTGTVQDRELTSGVEEDFELCEVFPNLGRCSPHALETLIWSDKVE